jgi:hypothetical protein
VEDYGLPLFRGFSQAIRGRIVVVLTRNNHKCFGSSSSVARKRVFAMIFDWCVAGQHIWALTTTREMEEFEETPDMNKRETGNSPMNTKKAWTAPVLEVILLNSAENTTVHTVSDGPPNRRS